MSDSHNRRGFISAIWPVPFLSALLHGSQTNDGNQISRICSHRWRKGNLWALTAAGPEEPNYAPPSGIVQIEICTGCGVLRIPSERLGSIVAL
jgi:hypothetical protein